MAGIGLSKPYYAVYKNVGKTVTYSGGGLIGKYTKLSITLNSEDENTLAGDNGPAESDKRFSGGNVNMTTTELEPDVMLPVLGLKMEEVTDDGLTSENAAWLIFDDDQNRPYIGTGGIIARKVHGEYKWQAFVLLKVQFSNPGIEAVTLDKTVEWQTPQLSATILRSDAEKHPWFMLSSFLDSEEDAEKLVRKVLMIPDEPVTEESA